MGAQFFGRGSRLGFGTRLRAGLIKPGTMVAAVAGLGLGLHGREAIEARSAFLTVASGLSMALLWAAVWLVVRTVLTIFIDLDRRAVVIGSVVGMLFGIVVVLGLLADDDINYMRDYRYVVVTLVIITSLPGALIGLVAGQIVALTRDRHLSRKATTARGRPSDVQMPNWLFTIQGVVGV